MEAVRGEVPQPVESTRSLEEWSPSPDAPVVRRLSVAGVAREEHDLAARSEEILRRELGHPNVSRAPDSPWPDPH
jgi:hypothetical protein